MMGHPSSRMDFPAEALALRVLFVDIKPHPWSRPRSPAQCPGRSLDSLGGELPRYSGAAGGDWLRAPDLARARLTTRL